MPLYNKRKAQIQKVKFSRSRGSRSMKGQEEEAKSKSNMPKIILLYRFLFSLL